jgi:ubiquinol-cytochrome c reductase cytochrome c subunit
MQRPWGKACEIFGQLCLAGVLAVVPALAVAGSAWASGPPAKDSDDLNAQQERGRQLWGQRCASCHGVGGQGSDQGPSLEGKGTATVDFMIRTGRMPLAVPGLEPVHAQAKLDTDEREAVVAYFATLDLKGPSIPDVDPSRGDLARGRDLFATHCAGCHGAQGAGAVLQDEAAAPPLAGAAPEVVAEAIRVGPYVMPRFGEDIIDQADLDSIVRYVGTFDDPDDRGGLSLGYVGPVAEGAVAWIVGLGLLFGVIRATGSKR